MYFGCFLRFISLQVCFFCASGDSLAIINNLLYAQKPQLDFRSKRLEVMFFWPYAVSLTLEEVQSLINKEENNLQGFFEHAFKICE